MSSVAPADLPVGKDLGTDRGRRGADVRRSPRRRASRSGSPRARRRSSSLIIAVIWTIPTFGLFISSFRPAELIQTTGWWTIFQNPGFTLENYQRRAVLVVAVVAAARRVLRELAGDRDPGDDLPARASRRWRRTPSRGCKFSGVERAVHHHLRAADHAAADGARAAAADLLDLAAADAGLAARRRSRSSPSRTTCRSGSRTRSSPCRWRSSCCTTSSRRSRAR